MDLEALRAFVTVVETGSFVGASRRLGLARATLRRRIDALEVEAGLPLLSRSHAGVVPTEAGALLAKEGRVLIQEAQILLSTVREVGDEPQGLLRVMLPAGLPPEVLAPFFGALRARYPRLRVLARASDDPLADLLEDVDVALYWSTLEPEGPWVSMELGRARQWLLAHPSYLALRGRPERVQDLSEHDLLCWAPPGEDGRRLHLVGGGEAEVEPVLASPDIHLLRVAASQGQGVAYVPDGLVPIPGLELEPVLPEQVRAERVLRVAVPSALEQAPRVRAVLTELRRLRDVILRGDPRQALL